jgi:hypothetical protein
MSERAVTATPWCYVSADLTPGRAEWEVAPVPKGLLATTVSQVDGSRQKPNCLRGPALIENERCDAHIAGRVAAGSSL